MSIKKSFNTAKGVYKVTFTLPAEAANGKKNVVLLGDFNNWDTSKAVDMKAGKTDFSASIELKPGTYQFRYLIDKTDWENDYQADNYVSSPFPGINNSVLFLPNAEKKVAEKKAAPAKKVTAPKVVAEKKVVAKVAKPVAKTTESKPSKAATPKMAATPKVAKTAAPKVAKPSAAKTGTKAPASATAKPAAVKAVKVAKK